MNRPLFPPRRRGFVACAILALTTLVGAKGCDSNYIGVQDYGSVIGNVVDQSGKPIASAFVRITGTTTTSSTDPKGGFLIEHVAVGQQTISAYAAGYNSAATLDVVIAKNQTASAGNVTLMSTTAPQRQTIPAPEPSRS